MVLFREEWVAPDLHRGDAIQTGDIAGYVAILGISAGGGEATERFVRRSCILILSGVPRE